MGHDNYYDHEKTSHAIGEMRGSSLQPLQMIHEDLKTCFLVVGKNKDKQDQGALEQAALVVEIANLKTGLEKLQTRLWGLLCILITETVGVAAAWLFM